MNARDKKVLLETLNNMIDEIESIKDMLYTEEYKPTNDEDFVSYTQFSVDPGRFLSEGEMYNDPPSVFSTHEIKRRFNCGFRRGDDV